MTRPPNVMGHYPNFIGGAPMGFNQYLEAPITAEPSLQAFTWSGRILTFYTPRISQGIIDHIHYSVTMDGSVPTLDELYHADVWNADSLVLTLPEASGIMVHMVAHDRFHRTRETGQDITPFGEYWIDLTPPSGQLFINDGAPVTMEQVVTLHTLGFDTLSGVAEMYIDGDVKGVNVKEWVNYEEYKDITLSDEEGKHTVLVRLKDHAGNVSDYFWNTIVYPLVRYFFKKTAPTANEMGVKTNTFTVQTKDMRVTSNEMKESDEHGRFGSN